MRKTEGPARPADSLPSDFVGICPARFVLWLWVVDGAAEGKACDKTGFGIRGVYTQSFVPDHPNKQKHAPYIH